MFWIQSALLALIALTLILWPILRPARGKAIAAQAASLREQLETLKAAHDAGLITAADFATRKQALSDAALALVDAPSVVPIPRSVTVVALILLVAIPVLMVLLYDRIGNPNALGFQGAGRGSVSNPQDAGDGTDAATSNAPDLAKAAETLSTKLASNPNDGEGWVLLARTYRAIDRHAESSAAYTKARALLPEESDLLAESAEVMGLSSNPRTLAGEPEKLIDRALVLDPNNQNALFLKGLARAQADDFTTAEASWEKLLGMMEAGTPAQAAVIEQLNQVRATLGKPPMEMPAPAAPTAEPETAAAPAEPSTATPTSASSDAAKAGIDVSVAISPELGARLAASDVLFVYARAESGPPMPLAIQRLRADQLPIKLRLDESMGMVAGMSMASFERVVIGARVSKSGNAQAQSGDFEVLSQPIEWRKAGSIELTIDKVR